MPFVEGLPRGWAPMSFLQRLRAAWTAQTDARALRAALQASPYPALRPPQTLPAGLLDARRQGFRLYEVFVLNEVVRALAAYFAAHPGSGRAGDDWEPRFPPEANVFLENPYFRLPLPNGYGELIWQTTYGRVPDLPVRSLSHAIRPDLVIERPDHLLILDAKYRRSRQATIEMLDDLHAYRDALVDRDGREVVRYAVAVTDASPQRSAEFYYAPEFFRQAGLGLVYLPAAGQRGRRGGLLTLEEVLHRYFTA